MRKNIVWFKAAMAAIVLAFTLPLAAQDLNNETLLTVDGQKITVGEFLNVYRKNNVQTDIIDKKTMEEYLELFINFKLKVRDAEVHGLDTVKALKNELAGYRKQLAAPYFVDDEVIEGLVKEAYDFMLYDLRASHILIRCDQNASPEDTLTAWNKISEVLNKAKAGADFGKLATEYSEDPSARDREATSQHPFIKGNQGDLGYFTAFNMVYPFEKAAYQTAPGEISGIVRTNFGYHIIKVAEKRKALGKAQVAHIFFQIPPRATAADSLKLQRRADSVYALFRNGEDFTRLVKENSDDKGSAMRDGVLPWFGCNRLVPEFIQVVYNLKPGEVSQPVVTSYGWHIIKMIDHKPIASFDELSNEIRQKVEKDLRYDLSKSSIIRKIKKDYSFSEDAAAFESMLKMVDDSLFAGTWKPLPASKMKKLLFRYADQKVTQAQFAEYLVKNQKKQKPVALRGFISGKYQSFVEETLMAYEDARLESKYPEFGLIMQEYRDGILLFELTQQKVWDKAVRDTMGLETFYLSVRENYMWPERKEATILQVKNLPTEKACSELASKLTEWVNLSDMTLETIKAKILEDSTLMAEVSRGKFVRGENSLIDGLTQPGQSSSKATLEENGKYTLDLTIFHSDLPAMPKELNEVKGHITAEYQNYLEKEWIRELRGKYPYTVNRSLLDKIK